MSQPSPAHVLMLWPSVPAWRFQGQLLIDRKFKDGMDGWCRYWPGRVRVVMHVIEITQAPAFGAHAWEAQGEEAAFELSILEPGAGLDAVQLEGVDVLLASADDHRQMSVATLCRSLGIPCIYVIEYTLWTRLAMLRYSNARPFAKLKSMVWLLLHERRLCRALGEADAIQANGLPALQAYTGITRASMHYFDTRLASRDVIVNSELERRLTRLRNGGPIRLAFSGRLIPAKGADDLVPLALELRKAGLDFRFDVYGSGESEPAMRDMIASNGLQDIFRMNGPVNFETLLVPALKRDIDLFICCHRQGDPSCTYAETLGCGVPIAGFANESLSSLIRAHGIGWEVRAADVAELATLVRRLSSERETIARTSRIAMEFGQAFHLEKAFEQRALHCASLVRKP